MILPLQDVCQAGIWYTMQRTAPVAGSLLLFYVIYFILRIVKRQRLARWLEERLSALMVQQHGNEA